MQWAAARTATLCRPALRPAYHRAAVQRVALHCAAPPVVRARFLSSSCCHHAAATSTAAASAPPSVTASSPAPDASASTAATSATATASASASAARPNGPTTLLLVDAMGLVFRQYFGYKNRHSPLLAQMRDAPLPVDAAAAAVAGALPAPASYSMRDVGALYGYASSLLNLCFVLQPTHVAACLDLGNRSSFRHTLFPDYKIDRKPVEDSLRWQLGHLARVTRALGIQPVTAPGFEADDVIGTLAHAASATDAAAATTPPAFDRVIILSSDKDFIQCLNGRVSMLSPKQAGRGGGVYVYLHESDLASVVGVPPHRFADYLVLLGDTADGIPGVPGVGPVRARQIVQHYDQLEHALDDIKTTQRLKGAAKGKGSEKVYEALLKSESDIPMWRDLATIRTNVPGLPDWDDLRYHGPISAPAAMGSITSTRTTTTTTSTTTTMTSTTMSTLTGIANSELGVTVRQQLHADSIASVFEEFGFPPPPSFVLPSSVAAASALATPFDAPSVDPSALPRLLTQDQWARVSSGHSDAEAELQLAAKVAADETTKPKAASKKRKSATATTKTRTKTASRLPVPATGLSVEQMDDFA